MEYASLGGVCTKTVLNGCGSRFRNVIVSVRFTFFGIAIHTGVISRLKILIIINTKYKTKQMQMHPCTHNETNYGCRNEEF